GRHWACGGNFFSVAGTRRQIFFIFLYQATPFTLTYTRRDKYGNDQILPGCGKLWHASVGCRFRACCPIQQRHYAKCAGPERTSRECASRECTGREWDLAVWVHQQWAPRE